jgi:hypothetical protein
MTLVTDISGSRVQSTERRYNFSSIHRFPIDSFEEKLGKKKETSKSNL